jgi:hypothetical protein
MKEGTMERFAKPGLEVGDQKGSEATAIRYLCFDIAFAFELFHLTLSN